MPPTNKQVWTNLSLQARFFGRVILLSRLTGRTQPDVPLIEKQLETLFFVLYYLNKTCSFHFQYISIKDVCNEALVAWLNI